MVTGDHQFTACEVARQVGIISPDSEVRTWDKSLVDVKTPDGAIIINSMMLTSMSQEELDHVTQFPEIVFARTTPAIVAGVEEGRLIFDNLKKSIAFTLSSYISKLVPFLAYLLLDIPLFLPIMFVIAIDIATDLLPGISYAYEKAESDLMQRKPRNPHEDRLVTAKLMSFAYLQIGVIQALGAFYAAVVIMAAEGIDPQQLMGLEPKFSDKSVYMVINGEIWSYDRRSEVLGKAQVGYFIGIVLTQIADGLICKTRKLSLWNQSWKNWWMLVGFVIALGVAALITYVDPIGSIFGAEPIPAQYWFISMPFCFLIIVYDEIRKFIIIIRRYPHGWVKQYTYY